MMRQKKIGFFSCPRESGCGYFRRFVQLEVDLSTSGGMQVFSFFAKLLNELIVNFELSRNTKPAAAAATERLSAYGAH